MSEILGKRGAHRPVNWFIHDLLLCQPNPRAQGPVGHAPLLGRQIGLSAKAGTGQTLGIVVVRSVATLGAWNYLLLVSVWSGLVIIPGCLDNANW